MVSPQIGWEPSERVVPSAARGLAVGTAGLLGVPGTVQKANARRTADPITAYVFWLAGAEPCAVARGTHESSSGKSQIDLR